MYEVRELFVKNKAESAFDTDDGAANRALLRRGLAQVRSAIGTTAVCKRTIKFGAGVHAREKMDRSTVSADAKGEQDAGHETGGDHGASDRNEPECAAHICVQVKSDGEREQDRGQDDPKGEKAVDDVTDGKKQALPKHIYPR